MEGLEREELEGKDWRESLKEFYSSETDSQLTQPQRLTFFPHSKYFFSIICISLYCSI
jgi:hypothetical protein